MPRSASPSATATIARWVMPAPAPCASTRQALAFAGFSHRAETAPPSVSIFRSRGAMPISSGLQLFQPPPVGLDAPDRHDEDLQDQETDHQAEHAVQAEILKQR